MKAGYIAFVLSAVYSPSSKAQVPEWRLSQRPVLQIGAVDADSLYLMHSITDLIRFSNGGLAVADRNGLRLYSPEGRFQRTAAQAGRGPGEYSTIGQLLLKGDSILLWDPARRNRLIYGPDGRYLRQERVNVDFLDSDGSRRFVSFEFSWLASPQVMLSRIQPAHDHQIGRLERLPQHFLLAELSTGRVHELGVYPGQVAIPLAEVDFLDHAWQPYTPDSYAAVGRDRIYIGDSGGLDIDVYTSSGERLRSIRLSREPRPVGRRQIEAAKERYLAAVPGAQRQRAERTWSKAPLPEVLPYYGGLFVDAAGRLWIADYTVEPERPSRWTILGTDGRELATVQLPARFTLKFADVDHVAGVWRDELDVEYAQVWALSRE
jgi:hypothetical protein